MRVLGVDPGSSRTGWGLLTGSAARPALFDCGTIRLRDGMPFAEKLHVLQLRFREVVERVEPTVAAVESPFHGVNARAAFQLAQARGVILAVLGGAGIHVVEYPPATVKKAVTGTGRAEKTQVRTMLRTILGGAAGADSLDASDALGIAFCHAATERFVARVAAADGQQRPRGTRRGA
jgi:crossover junction endodeoxyribonuclease RuvC